MKRFVFPLILFVLALAACTAAPQETTTQNTATWTPTETATATPLPTSTATPTSTPTATPTPLVLPVTNGTPVPDLSYEVITAENITRLQQVARYGYPRLLGENSFYTVIPYRLTADGKTLVVGTTLGLELYDAQTQEKTGGFDVEFLESFDMTPDGQYILTFAGETLTVWTRDGEKVREFDELEIGDAWELNPVAISPDGTLLAVQRVNTDWQEADKVDVYRVADGSLVDTVRGNGVVFSAQYLATVFDGSVRLYPVAELGQGWETRLPKQTLPWCGASEGVTCGLAFSPDGTQAAVIRPSRVDVYQVADREMVRQVSGWETDRYSALPRVQFAGGQLLIVTSPIYDASGIKVKPRAIVVDIASGEWLNESEVQDGFAYLTDGQVRGFVWKAEAEMPYFWRPEVSINDDGQMIVRELLFDGEYAICVNQDCVRTLSDSDGKYELQRDTNRFNIVEKDTGDVLLSSSAPQDVFIRFQVFPSSAGDVVFVETSRGVNANAVAYRADGRRAEIASDFVMKILPAGNKIAFSVFGEGIKVLDVEQWSVKRFAGEELLYFSGDKAYIADDDAIQVLDVMSGKSEYIPVPGWRMGSTWQGSGFAVAESAEKTENLFLVSTGGVVYAIDLDKTELIAQIKTIAPYSNAVMKFSQDNRFLFTFGMDGFIHVWAVIPEPLTAQTTP
jgi:hypothetical protein